MFETLWIDKPNAEEKLRDLAADPATKDVASHLEQFHKNGFCIIPNAVSPETIDQYMRECKELIDNDKLQISLGDKFLPAKGADILIPLTKVLDVHIYSDAAQRIAFAPPLKKFMEYLFGEPALAFQTLHFETGSTQSVHNDTAYVVLDEPKSLTASWVALEDIQPGSGELVYYPGSHRFGDFLYQNSRKHWSLPEDGHEIHNHHLSWIHLRAKEEGIALQSFRPKKGDALFWHADLAHGGGPITRQNTTRRSLVTHYCPAHCTPHYFQFIDPSTRVKREIPSGGYVSSFYYNLAPDRAPNAA